MQPFVRNILAVIVGLVAGSLVNMGLVTLGPRVIPPPTGVDMSTPEGLQAAMPLLAPRHFVFPFLAHALGTFVGALVACRMAGSRGALFAWVIGVLFLGGGIAACLMIPAPKWFIALDLLGAYLPMAWIASRLGAGRPAKAA
jgi:hypothetical protein